MTKNKLDYKLAGVDINAGNEAVDLIKDSVKSTFSKNVLIGLGGFGALYDLKSIIKEYEHPVLVQSIDGVGKVALPGLGKDQKARSEKMLKAIFKKFVTKIKKVPKILREILKKKRGGKKLFLMLK